MFTVMRLARCRARSPTLPSAARWLPTPCIAHESALLAGTNRAFLWWLISTKGGRIAGAIGAVILVIIGGIASGSAEAIFTPR